jgi:hypothetical protein
MSIKPKIRIEPCDNGFVVTTATVPEGKIISKIVFTSLEKLLDYIEDTYAQEQA